MAEFNGEIMNTVDLPTGGTAVQVRKDPPVPPARRYPGAPCPITDHFSDGDKVTFDLVDPSEGHGQEVAYNIKKI